MEPLHRVDDGSGIVQQSLVGHKPGQHHNDADVQECANHQRGDLPNGIIATLVICTLLYIGVVVVLTGLVPYQTLLDDAAPVVNTMKRLHFGGVRLVVLIGALMGMISSLLVFQLGQARVWFAMSRDGLLPRIFARVHPTFRTPDFSTW